MYMLCKICDEEVTKEKIGKTVSRLTEREDAKVNAHPLPRKDCPTRRVWVT